MKETNPYVSVKELKQEMDTLAGDLWFAKELWVNGHKLKLTFMQYRDEPGQRFALIRGDRVVIVALTDTLEELVRTYNSLVKRSAVEGIKAFDWYQTRDDRAIVYR